MVMEEEENQELKAAECTIVLYILLVLILLNYILSHV